MDDGLQTVESEDIVNNFGRTRRNMRHHRISQVLGVVHGWSIL